MFLYILLLLLAIALSACASQEAAAQPGPQGPAGPQGPEGPAGQTLTEEQTQALDAAAMLSGIQFPGVEEALRGCPACHTLIHEETGRYTLSFEAHERAEARGGAHPEVAPDGTSITATDDVNVNVCLQCHALGTDNWAVRGVIAPLS